MKVKYCPNCRESLEHPKSMFNEYWNSLDTIYFCWCHKCSWQGEINEITRIIAPELASSNEEVI